MEFFGHNGKTKVEIVYSNYEGEPTAILVKDFRSEEHLEELELHFYQTVYPQICFQESLLS